MTPSNKSFLSHIQTSNKNEAAPPPTRSVPGLAGPGSPPPEELSRRRSLGTAAWGHKGDHWTIDAKCPLGFILDGWQLRETLNATAPPSFFLQKKTGITHEREREARATTGTLLIRDPSTTGGGQLRTTEVCSDKMRGGKFHKNP